jgi:hypothetical protein
MRLMRRLGMAIFALPLLTAGCMVGPDFHQPSVPVASHWLESDTTIVARSIETGGESLMIPFPTDSSRLPTAKI